MATFIRTLQQNHPLIYAALLLVLGALLIAAPAEARLGNVVKIVYAHGAAERVAVAAYWMASILGIVYCAGRAFQQSPPRISNLQSLTAWTRATTETALLFWFAHIIISAPAQILAWGTITLSEPRVAGALNVLIATTIVYAAARWMDKTWVWAVAAIVNVVIVGIVLRNALNILHPIDPILGSDSITIKVFYAGIVVVMGVLAVQVARQRAQAISKRE
ncbi:MAG: hypothetical protein N2559_00815 [Anaerolineae bacterium]|nr:hypothetical protein [Anaerolineae bacterium]